MRCRRQAPTEPHANPQSWVAEEKRRTTLRRMVTEYRRLAEELGYWPATTDPHHLSKLRADNDRFDRMNAHDPQGLKWSKMGGSSAGER